MKTLETLENLEIGILNIIKSKEIITFLKKEGKLLENKGMFSKWKIKNMLITTSGYWRVKRTK